MSNKPAHPQIAARRLVEALGGRKAANEKLNREFEELAKRWDQDAGLIGRILRAHLFVEHYLSAYLAHTNPRLGDLSEARLSFAQKVALIEPSDPSVAWLIPGIRRLNRVRNTLAHTLLAEVTDADRDALLSIGLFAALREALAAPHKPSLRPEDVLEDFGKHAGIALAHSSSPLATAFRDAWWGESPQDNAEAT